MHYSIVKGVPDEKCRWLKKSAGGFIPLGLKFE